MKKLLLAAAFAALAALQGCALMGLAGPPAAQTLVSAPAPGIRANGAATLAKVGTCEVDVAADYTALIIYRRQAARLVTAGKMSVPVATTVQSLGDEARRQLDAACVAQKLNPDALTAARKALGGMRIHLEAAQ